MTTHYNYNPEGVPLSHHEDSEEQLVIGSERDFIDLQEPELVRSIGAAALRRAQEQLGVYFHCRDNLEEYGHEPKSRIRKIDLVEKYGGQP
ncbi:hypothetical protein AS590_25840 [Prescottella equi]|uniref:hypothetical protein n=1 Tax=Rhodococcus qingshengii TaxID=334542 RepID=UPI00080B6233|nr:hypothetical protein [Rhodococcus qingshengii]OCC19419.1 hypothetical protein AS590_25840 [Prescottella equi]